MGYAPDSIQHIYDEVHAAVPQTALGGIHGHKPGYHACRAYHQNRGAWGDYSIQKPDDKVGDVNAGSALDITFSNVDDEIRLMKRLMQAATSGDKRVWNLREFFGTVNGSTVTGYDPRGGYYVTSDDSHLWHIHISFYRKFATSMSTANDVIAVMLARDSDDMTKDEAVGLINQAMQAYHYGGNHGPFTQDDFGWVHNADDGIGDRLTEVEQRTPTNEINDAINSLFWGGDHGKWTQAKYAWVEDAGNGVSDRLNRLEG